MTEPTFHHDPVLLGRVLELLGAVPAGTGASLLMAAVLAALFVVASPAAGAARMTLGGPAPPDASPPRDERPG